MKRTMTVLGLLLFLAPAEARKMPKSTNAKGYATHKAPKVKAHRATRAKSRRAN